MPSFLDESLVHCFASHEMRVGAEDEEEEEAVACGRTEDSNDVSYIEPDMVEKSWSLCDAGDDSLSTVLSFLSPSDIVKCLAMCRHLKAFCKDDKTVWFPMCQRRWGMHTSIQNWGRQNVMFKVLYSVLTKLENLVGFWRGVDHGGHGSVIVLEWGPHFVNGYRVTPSRPSSHRFSRCPSSGLAFQTWVDRSVSSIRISQ